MLSLSAGAAGAPRRWRLADPLSPLRLAGGPIRLGLSSIVAAAAVVLLATPVSRATAAPRFVATSSSSPYVGRQSTQLVLGGQPWNFAGYNLPCQQPFTMTQTALENYFQEIQNAMPAGSHGVVVRMWWFQSNMGSGSNPWTPFDTIVAAANAVGVKVLPALTNQWQTCDEPSPPTPEKELPWYQGGYQQAEGGYALSFEQFATQLATHFASEPAIAFWQLVNEAEAPSSTGCSEGAAASALRSFSDSMVAALHQVDPNHLVNLGTQGAGECGISGGDYGYVHAGALDLCEFHDYTNPAIATQTGPDSLSSDIAACHGLGKPIFIGESGIPGNVQPDGSSGSAAITLQTLAQRAQFFKAKIDAFQSAGGVGYDIWFKSPFYTVQQNNLQISNGDPTEPVLADALTPTGPAPTTPEFPVPAVVLLVAAVMAGAFAVWRERRTRYARSTSA